MSEINKSEAVARIEKLIAPGLLGFYSRVDVVQIVGFPDGKGRPENVISIMVGEDSDRDFITEPEFIGDRIKVPGIRGWKFGIARFFLNVEGLVPFLIGSASGPGWVKIAEMMGMERLVSLPPRFVPPDPIIPVPVNNLLKNNFWCGSHLFEWVEPNRTLLQTIFQDSRHLQELSRLVNERIPIRIAPVSDKIGSLLVQLPVEVICADFSGIRDSSDLELAIAWNRKAEPRPLRVNVWKVFDGQIASHWSGLLAVSPMRLPVTERHGPYQAMIWDDLNQTVLASIGPVSVLASVQANIGIGHPEPRYFKTANADGSSSETRVELTEWESRTLGSSSRELHDWTNERIYNSEAAEKARERSFIQYRPDPGKNSEWHLKALQDVRALINRYGEKGAWLWDPYLSSRDIFDTLFHCEFFNSDLRALTAGKTPPPEEATEEATGGVHAFVERQRRLLEDNSGNCQGLRLEYRIRTGAAGWGFHDRFLIFPEAQGSKALAWSLGSSVNSLGKQHHIFQRVDDGQLILDAFRDLWERLDQPKHLIWRRP